MARLRIPVLALSIAVTALTAAACANTPTVQVCDPCGCRCVAAPILTGCGEVARPAEGAGAAPTSDSAATPTKTVLDPTSDVAVEQILARKRVRGLAWDGENLDTALTYLRTITGLRFTISPRARQEKFDDVVYNLHLDEVAVKNVLDLITEPFGLRWEPREGVVWILTREEIDGPTRLRYFDVKDLTFTVFRRGPGARVAVSDRDRFRRGEALLETIRREVHPEYWDEEDVALEAHSGILIVRASRAVLDDVGGFLMRERRKRFPAGLSPEWKKKTEETRISLVVKETSLVDVIKALQIRTGMSLMIDPRIKSEVALKPTTGLQLSEAPLATALAILASVAGSNTLWVSRGPVLVLTRQELLDGP